MYASSRTIGEPSHRQVMASPWDRQAQLSEGDPRQIRVCWLSPPTTRLLKQWTQLAEGERSDQPLGPGLIGTEAHFSTPQRPVVPTAWGPE